MLEEQARLASVYMNANLYLYGAPGSGKSTFGRQLAAAKEMPFVDLDDEIEACEGRKIADIFAQDGEPAFRLLEAQVLRKTVEKYAESTAVLALGGGAVLAPASAALLHEKTVCIYLRATLDTLLARLAGETAGRPLLQEIPDQVGDDGGSVVMPGPDRASVSARLASREPIYEKTAHVIIDTDGLSPDEVADEIIISAL
jgi:shikimate kinase